MSKAEDRRKDVKFENPCLTCTFGYVLETNMCRDCRRWDHLANAEGIIIIEETERRIYEPTPYY